MVSLVVAAGAVVEVSLVVGVVVWVLFVALSGEASLGGLSLEGSLWRALSGGHSKGFFLR